MMRAEDGFYLMIGILIVAMAWIALRQIRYADRLYQLCAELMMIQMIRDGVYPNADDIYEEIHMRLDELEEKR